MAEAPITVALLAGQVGRRGEVRRLARLVDRLNRLGITIRLLVSGGASLLLDVGVEAIEDPWLDRPWLRWFAVRRLLAEANFEPDLLHVLHDEVADAASMLALRWQKPLIRTISEYPSPEAFSRFDARGYSALVVGDEGLAQHLISRVNHLNPKVVRLIAPGCEPPAPLEGNDAEVSGVAIPDRVPVIGAIGHFAAGSGFETFLDAIRRVVESGRDVEFLVAGFGSGESRIRRRAERLELVDRLTFAGPAVAGGPLLEGR